MRILSALGVLAGGFFMSPPSIVTLLWLGARLYPVATVVAVVAVALAWRADHD